jgi:hypothetical protein
MHVTEPLRDAIGRVVEIVREVLDDLPEEALVWRPDPDANPIGWLVWHLARVQDDHVADLAGTSQVWASGEWAARFGLPADTMEIGYGHRTEEVAAVRPDDTEVLLSYLEVVTEQTDRFLEALDADELERIIDRSWDPPVTVAVRLVSVIGDTLQHAGQAAYVRGLYERRG